MANGFEQPPQLGAAFLGDADQLRQWVGGVLPVSDDFPKRMKADMVFERAIDDTFQVARRLVDSLTTNAPPRDREIEAAKARERSVKRFGA